MFLLFGLGGVCLEGSGSGSIVKSVKVWSPTETLHESESELYYL